MASSAGHHYGASKWEGQHTTLIALTCFKLEEQSRTSAMVFVGNMQRHCPVSFILGAPVRESAARPSARCAWRPARCAVQVAAPATEGSTGTYTGKGIKGPVVGSHFLHIDDFSKEVSKGCLLCHVFSLAVVTKNICKNALYKLLHAFSPLFIYLDVRHCMCCCLAAASMENTQLALYNVITLLIFPASL